MPAHTVAGHSAQHPCFDGSNPRWRAADAYTYVYVGECETLCDEDQFCAGFVRVPGAGESCVGEECEQPYCEFKLRSGGGAMVSDESGRACRMKRRSVDPKRCRVGRLDRVDHLFVSARSAHYTAWLAGRLACCLCPGAVPYEPEPEPEPEP